MQLPLAVSVEAGRPRRNVTPQGRTGNLAEGQKKCFKCGQVKLFDDFYKHPRMADGRLGKCKICTRKDTRSRWLEKVKDPIWLEMERERVRLKERKRAQLGLKKKQSAEQKRIQWLKDHDKMLARKRAYNAVLFGKITKPTRCSDCGIEKPLDMHHPDYTRALFVVFLCKECHGKRHRKIYS